MVTASSRLDRAWEAQHESRPLPADLRDRFERALDVDLSAVRVHTGPAADAAAQAFGADAVASGSAVFFRNGAYHPDDRAGLHLLAHEVVHTVQQAGGNTVVSSLRRDGASVTGKPHGDDPWEAQADRFADAFVAPMTAAMADRGSVGDIVRARGRGRNTVRVLPGPCPSGTVQRHASFEHRYLGDGRPQDLYIISTTPGPHRTALLDQQIRLMALWRYEPHKVGETDVERVMPGTRTLRLGPDRVLATYGDVNALPDYMADAEQVDSTGADILLPILQVIRQEGFNELTKLATGFDPGVQFALAPFKPVGWGLVDAIAETRALDKLTAGFGVAGQDHYRGLLARNACHFAPYSWHRWSASHITARLLAVQAHRTTDPARKAELIRRAWNCHGYADHFLQDSFAAGHLIDKTLVMQWFVEWAGDSDLLADQHILRYMTAALQPGLAAGPLLYDPSYQGPSHDPQTVQELRRLAERSTGAGNGPGRETGRLTGYLDYLTFLTSAASQLGAASLHDHYNSNSLWVASVAHPEPYRIWGDDTLLSGDDGGPGVLHTAETAQLSRRSLEEIIRDGGTPISMNQIRRSFPMRAGADQGDVTDLRGWATGQREWVEETVFKGFMGELEDLLLQLGSPRLGVVSRDQSLGERWTTGLGGRLAFDQATVLPVGGRLFAASDGYVYELDSVTGATAEDKTVVLPHVSLNTTTALAADADRLFIGVSGRVHALPLHGAWGKQPTWTSPALGGGDTILPVSLLLVGGRLFAASHGYVYELDPNQGTIRQRIELGSRIGVGAYPVDLTTDGEMIYAGTHAYVYALTLHTPWNDRSVWYSAKLGKELVYQPVTVLDTADGRLFAASNGYAYELSRADGRIVRKTELIDAGLSDCLAAFAMDEGRLYVGSHGHACALPLDADWGERPLWTTERLSVLYPHSPVAMLYLDDRLFAGCDGYVFELDLLDGAVRQQWLLTTLLATGLDFSTSLAANGANVYAGTHGYAYGMLLASLQPTPSAAWPLSQSSGTNVPDRRGIHPATAKNVSWRPLSALGACAVFNGQNSSIDTRKPVLDTGPGRGFTVAARVRLDSLPSSSTATVLSQAGNIVSAFSLGYSASLRSWVFERAAADVRNPVPNRVSAATTATPGVWVHVAGVYDPNAVSPDGTTVTRMRIYINGSQKAAVEVDPTRAFASSGPLQIGVAKYDSRPDGWLQGAVRDVRVYDRALDEPQLEPEAAAFWRLDDGSGTTAVDQCRAHDAVATDVRWESIAGVGGCATLNGAVGGITTKNPVINTGVGGSFTVAAWVRLNSLPSQPVTLLGQDAQAVSAFCLQYIPATTADEPSDATTGGWSFVRYTSDRPNATAVTLNSGVTARPGTWIHVTGVYDAWTTAMHVYVNGTLRNSEVFNRSTAFDANGAFTIGHGRYNGVVSGRLPGTVRDVRAYNQVLSAEQVKALLDNPS